MSSFGVIPPTSLGTGVAKTSLGTIQKPTKVTRLIEFIPYYAPTGAVTAGQSMLLETALESDSISLVPKRIINPPIQAGLGATFASQIPMLESYECNTPLEPDTTPSIEAFGQAQVANTVAPVMGVGFHWDNMPNPRRDSKEMFYQKPDDETSTGTTATVVQGGTIDINSGKILKILMGCIAAGTVTASEALIGSLQFNSSDYKSSQPLEVPLQPVNSGLGTLVGMIQPKGSIYKEVNMGLEDSVTITTALRLSEALTAAGNFIGAVGYTK